jgi:hypothetical protein
MATPETAQTTATATAANQQNIAVNEIKRAWAAYQQTEKYGLDFGQTCCEWRTKFKAQGKKGQGLLPILEQVGIPISTAYWWMERYEISVGTKQAKPKVTVPLSQEELDPIKARCVPKEPGTRKLRDVPPVTKQGKFERSNRLCGLFPKEWRFNFSEHGDNATKPLSISLMVTEEEVKQLAEIITLGVASLAAKQEKA